MKKLLSRVRTELARERENIYDIKFGYGGEMELDYILQYLQLVHGEREPGIRAGNSWEALERLREFKLIEERESQHLLEALNIFRRVASRLRIYQDRPEHLVSLEPLSLERLARKVARSGIETGAKLKKRIESARERVRELFLKYIGE